MKAAEKAAAADFDTAWLAATCTQSDIDARRIRNDVDVAVRVERGLPAKAVMTLVRHGVPERELFRSVVSQRTFQRRLAEGHRLTAVESDRAERFARTLALAALVFDDEELGGGRRLNAARTDLKGRSPAGMLGSSAGANVVRAVLLQSFFGIVS